MSTVVATRLAPDHADRLRAMCADNGVTVAEWLRMAAVLAEATVLEHRAGHSSVAITLDRYGHLMPGSEAEAAELLNTYLEANA